MKKIWMYFISFFLFADLFTIACSQAEVKNPGVCPCRTGVSVVCP